MFSNLPIEVVEIILKFLSSRDIYSLSKVDSTIAEIFKKSKNCVIVFPKQIDWSSPSAPKQYIPYDKTNFRVYYKGSEYKREDGISFTISRNIATSADNTVVLDLNNLVIEGGKATFADKAFVVNTLKMWPHTAQKPKIVVKPCPKRVRGDVEDELDFRIMQEIDRESGEW